MKSPNDRGSSPWKTDNTPPLWWYRHTRNTTDSKSLPFFACPQASVLMSQPHKLSSPFYGRRWLFLIDQSPERNPIGAEVEVVDQARAHSEVPKG